MKQPAITFSLALITSLNAFAQKTTFEGSAGAQIGYHGNLYEAPVDYQVNDSVYYGANDLIKNDFVYGFQAKVNFKTKLKDKKGRLLYSYAGKNLLYLKETNGNLNEHDFKLKYMKTLNKKWSSNTGLTYVRSQKLGLNALGQQLVISLAYHGFKLDQDFVYKLNKKEKLKLSGALVYKDYDRRGNEETMTHWDYGYKANYYKEYKKNRKLEVFGGFRYKQFTEVKNMDILNPDRIDFDPITQFMPDTFPDKQNWTWTYLNLGTSYKFRLKKYMYLTPQINYTNRTDISESDFSYHSIDLSARWKYSRLKYGFELKAKYDIKNYTERLAAAPNKALYPLLKYRTSKCKIEAYYRLKKKWYLTFDGQIVYRYSNVEVNTERVRRTYFANQALLGVKYQFKGKIGKSDKKKK